MSDTVAEWGHGDGVSLQSERRRPVDNVGEDHDDSDAQPWEQLPEELLNKENRILTKQIKEQEIKMRDLDKKIEDGKERVKVLEDHFKNVQSELIHTQRLRDAKEKEIEGENHYIQLAEREIGRVKDETKRYSEMMNSLADQVRALVCLTVYGAFSRTCVYPTHSTARQHAE